MDGTHKQGLRVIDGDLDRPDEQVLAVVLQNGDDQKPLGEITTDAFAVDGVDSLALHRFMHYFTVAIARGLQLGISIDTMSAAMAKLKAIVGETSVTPQLPVVGIDVDDVFETLYRLPGDEFLRVVEDEYSEVMTADDLRELIDERQR